MTARPQKLNALRRSKLFKNVDDDIIVALADLVQEIKIPKGDLLMRNGGSGRAMYIIAEGEVHIIHHDIVIARLYENDIVGELSLLTPMARTANVRAVTTCILYRLKRTELMHLVAQQHQIALNLIKVLTERIILLNDRTSSLTEQLNTQEITV